MRFRVKNLPLFHPLHPSFPFLTGKHFHFFRGFLCHLPLFSFKTFINRATSWLCSDLCVCVSHSVVSDSRKPMDCSPSDSSVYGISQARILEWVAISFSRRSSQLRDWIHVSFIGWAESLPLSHPRSPVAVDTMTKTEIMSRMQNS